MSKETPNWQKNVAQKTAQMGFPIYSGAEIIEMLTEAVPDEGWGWLCALGIK